MTTYTASNRRHDGDNCPCTPRTCRNQNCVGPTQRPSSRRSPRCQTETPPTHQNPGQEGTKNALSRYWTSMGQAQKGREGTDSKLRHEDTPDKLHSAIGVKYVMGIVRYDRRGHKLHTMNFESLSPDRRHDVMFRTGSRMSCRRLYVKPTNHQWTLMYTQVTFKRTVTTPIIKKVNIEEQMKQTAKHD